MNSVFIIPQLGNFVKTGFPGCLKWLLGVVGEVMLNKVSYVECVEGGCVEKTGVGGTGGTWWV